MMFCSLVPHQVHMVLCSLVLHQVHLVLCSRVLHWGHMVCCSLVLTYSLSAVNNLFWCLCFGILMTHFLLKVPVSYGFHHQYRHPDADGA